MSKGLRVQINWKRSHLHPHCDYTKLAENWPGFPFIWTALHFTWQTDEEGSGKRVKERILMQCETRSNWLQNILTKRGEFAHWKKQTNKHFFKWYLMLYIPRLVSLHGYHDVTLSSSHPQLYKMLWPLKRWHFKVFLSLLTGPQRPGFLPGIIKLNRILMGPGRLVKSLPGPGSAVLLLPLLLPNAVRLHIQAAAK